MVTMVDSQTIYRVSVEQRELLDAHLRLVMQANEQLNLTRITSWEDAQVLHVEDSLVGVPEVLAAPDGNMADIGSGAGFPGIPLAVMTGRPVLLVDSVAKKMAAMQTIVDELGLSSVRTYAGRVEELSLEQPGGFAVVTARALSSLPSLLELAAPLLQMGGYLICYKGTPSADELEQSCALKEKLGMALVSQRNVVLSDGITSRTIVVYEKVSESQVKLPRRPGMAQKRPYRS